MELLVKNQCPPAKRLPIPRKRLRELLAVLLESEEVPRELARNMELSVVFCEDDFIHALNREYREKDRPTDVLSFPQDPDEGLLGDLVISVPTATRQAAERQQSLATEVEWLFLHGCLHLLGYEDDTDEQADEMDRRARRAQALLRERQNVQHGAPTLAALPSGAG